MIFKLFYLKFTRLYYEILMCFIFILILHEILNVDQLLPVLYTRCNLNIELLHLAWPYSLSIFSFYRSYHCYKKSRSTFAFHLSLKTDYCYLEFHKWWIFRFNGLATEKGYLSYDMSLLDFFVDDYFMIIETDMTLLGLLPLKCILCNLYKLFLSD
jgi:hypothetical protein